MTKKEKPKLFNKEFQKNWSDTHRYKHIHTGEYCTFEAYVAEYLIIRKAEAFKETKPAYKFWTKGEKLYPAFVRQVKAVIKLKKKFPEEIILGAIKSKYFEKIFYIGLYEKNYVGWKMNPLAAEAIECYHKDRIEEERLRNIKKQNDEVELKSESKEVVRRTKKHNTNNKSINRLRNL